MIYAKFKNNIKNILIDGLTQWDFGRKLCISGIDIHSENPEIHFAHEREKVALRQFGIIQDGDIIVDIPNVLLTDSHNIVVYVYDSTVDCGKTIATINIRVKERAKPDDYTDIESKNVLQEIYNIANSIKQDADNGVFDGYSPSILLTEVNDGIQITIKNKDGEITSVIKNGKDGLNGESAYQIAVRFGFDGTEQEWIESLKGENGDSGGNKLIGEVLLAEYIHQGNPEFHFSEFDFETGIGTTTEPHGLTENTEVLMCTNDFDVNYYTKDIMTFPIEWTMTNSNIDDSLMLSPIDDIHLKLTTSKGDVIPVDLQDKSNEKVDISKFHFEKPIAYHIKNIDNKINSKCIRILQTGYCMYSKRYRYRKIKVLTEDGKLVELPYINITSFVMTGNTTAKNGIIHFSDLIVDLSGGFIEYYEKLHCMARRKGSNNIIIDNSLDEDVIKIKMGDVVPIAISEFYSYSEHYAYMCNGTRIKIYALEGECKDES